MTARTGSDKRMSLDRLPALAQRTDFLSGSQKLGQCIRDHNWSATPFGPIETWPQSLRTALSACLGSPLVTALLWGPDHRLLYNDAYAVILKDRHPEALGRPILEVWTEIGDLLAGQLAHVVRTEQGFVTQRQQAVLQRAGIAEETHWLYTFAPIRGENEKIVGILNTAVETTAQVLAERARLESERRLQAAVEPTGLGSDFRALFEASPTPLVVVSPPDWIIVAANDARLALTGATRAEQIGRKLFEAFPDDPSNPQADGVRNLAASLERVVATATTDVMAVQRYDIQDASARFIERWWSPVNTPIPGEDGKVALVIHRVEEVTEVVRLRGEAEARDQLVRDMQAAIDRERGTAAALRASEEFNRQVLASSADCIKVLDLEGRLQFMSEGGMCVMEVEDFGAVQGMCWPDFWHGDGHGQVLGAIDVAKQGGTGRFQGFATTMKGSPRWWDVIVTAMLGADGAPEKLLSISRDITATKKAEVRLREINDTLESEIVERTAERDRMWDTSPDLMLIIDFQGVFQRVNPAWTTMLGYPAEELVGHHVNEFVIPEDHRETVGSYEMAADGGRPSIVNRYRHKNGSIRHISWVAAPAGDVTYATGRDVTAEREAALGLMRTQDALRQAQKMEALGQLAGGIAHDFNNVLQSVSGGMNMIRRRTEDPAAVRKIADMVADASARGASITRRLLSFARQGELQSTAIDPVELLAGLTEMLTHTLGSGVIVRTGTAPGTTRLFADKAQLETVLVNLAVNARDAMPDGGTLTIFACTDTIPGGKSGGSNNGDFVKLTVSDTGDGMDASTLARAGEPFFTTKPLGQGTGLGLAMAKGFSEQSGGGFNLASEPGRGTTVTLWLPQASETTRKPDGDGEEALQRGIPSTNRILLVDDDAMVRILLAAHLEDVGYDVAQASDGLGALARLDGGELVDLLVTDFAMPGMDGLTLIQEARKRRPDLPVLLLTGYADASVRDRLQVDPNGNTVMLLKPVSPQELASRASALLTTPPQTAD